MTATKPSSDKKKNSSVRENLKTIRGIAGLDYFALRTIIFSLIGIGVVMAFSASMATSLTETGGVWQEAIRQCIMVGAGLFLFWVMLKISPHSLRKLVPWLLLASVILLILVLIPGIGAGRDEVGSQSWILIGPLSIQPSELARVSVGLYGATALADKQHKSFRISDPFMMYSLVAGAMFLLIVAQGDLGMAMSFALVVVITLIFAGVNWRVPAVVAVLAALGLVAVFVGGGFRSHRFHTYFDALRGNIEDTQGTGFQAYQGFLSLADGGATGVGLGQSRAKWFYLPEAKNDFVFAIVGEELGLWGGALVILLFAALGYFGLRTARNAQNQFQALLAATLSFGVVTQAFFNIGYVVGLLPVTGIQLPMISAGGTAAIITIAAMGILCNVARHEPENISAMQNYGRPFMDRILGIGEPTATAAPKQTGKHSAPAGARTATRSGQNRGYDRERRFGQPVTGRRPVTERNAATESRGERTSSRRSSAAGAGRGESRAPSRRAGGPRRAPRPDYRAGGRSGSGAARSQRRRGER
ncbi:FtsW/RodA/SpoVE family cell cycle protein [Corynebacterium camporealensis]